MKLIFSASPARRLGWVLLTLLVTLLMLSNSAQARATRPTAQPTGIALPPAVPLSSGLVAC